MPVYLKDVRDELRQFGRSPRKYTKYRVTQLQSRGSSVTKSISYKGVVIGETNNYQVHIQFFKVEFLGEKPADLSKYKSIQVDGKKMWYKIPSVRTNPVNIKCSDPDFRFRFEKEMYDNNGLIGNWRRYTRKTPPPPVGRPYVNPKHYMGFCKHIWSLLDFLKSGGLLRE